MYLLADAKDQLYICGLMWFGMQMECNWMDEAFKKGMGHGGVVAKMKNR